MRPHDNLTAAAATACPPLINWIAPVNCLKKANKHTCTHRMHLCARKRARRNSCNDLLNTIKIDTDLHYRETSFVSIFCCIRCVACWNAVLSALYQCSSGAQLSKSTSLTGYLMSQFLNERCTYAVFSQYVCINRWVALFQYTKRANERLNSIDIPFEAYFICTSVFTFK